MTYCVTMKVRDGLVGIADTRVTSGNECISAKKVTVWEREGRHAMFIMTSGLRAVRDKAMTYFHEVLNEQDEQFTKLYQAVNAFAKQVRRVADEDKKALTESGLHFNLNALVAGQLEDDKEHMLYMLYPEGNWVEVGDTSPFFIIGNTGYGKPLLSRVLHYEASMRFALKAGFYSFDSTRKCANDVYYPIDVVLYKRDSFHIVSHRYTEQDLQKNSFIWQNKISQVLAELPDDWMEGIFDKLDQELT